MSRRSKAWLLSVLIYTAIIVVLYLIRFWPPHESEALALGGGGGGGGIELNMADNTASNTPMPPLETTPVLQAPQEQEALVSSDATDAEAVMPTPPESKPIKKTPSPQLAQPTKAAPAQPKPRELESDQVLRQLMAGGDGGSGEKAGGGSGGPGSGPGSGGGSGGGQGSGRGQGTGSGIGLGSGGGSGGGNYQLGNRKAISKPRPEYTCNEQGTVVVAIVVDPSGKVIEARPGQRGTTNTAACLLEQAKRAALQTSWQPDADAPQRQVGKIIYAFQLQ